MEVMDNDYTDELSDFDKSRLASAAADLGDFGAVCPGVTRYNFYRRHGHRVEDALLCALAWCRNSVEQANRRLSHETGAEGWRRVAGG